MADYTRPASGYRLTFSGMKTNAPADGMPENKYPFAQNIRGTDDNSIQSRPPIVQSQQPPAVGSGPVLSLEPTLKTYKIADKLFYANGTAAATLLDSGYSPTLGASIVPFRPSASPNAWDYVFDDVKSSKVYIPTSGSPVVNKVGVAEPLIPLEAGVDNELQNFMGEPAGGAYSSGGTAGAISLGARVNDVVTAVYQDPVISGRQTLQVSSVALAAKVYLASGVTAYFWPNDHSFNGAFGFPYPLDTGTASKAAAGNSLNFNPAAFNGTEDPNVQPMEWATIDAAGAITGYHVPWSGATEQYAMVVVTQVFVPAAGNYNLQIKHDDGMIFAIQGAKLVSGPHSDSFNHQKTAVGGYKFTNATVAGTNQSGYRIENFIINFPAPGVYAMEIDFAQWVNEQALNVWNNGSSVSLFLAGTQSYQRFMAVLLNNTVTVIQDVFPPLPQSLDIAGIYYFTGSTGHCVVVPSQIPSGPGTEGQSLFTQNVLAGLRRGALVQIGSEICLVWNTSVGPDGNICFETSTVSHHTASESLSGIPAIQIIGAASPGDAVTSPDVEVSVTTGIGTVTEPINVNPFVGGAFSFQEDDYVHLSLNIDNLAGLNEIKFLLDVGDGSFEKNFYYFSVRPSDIAAGVQNVLTQLGTAQLVSQRATIDEEIAAESKNQGKTASSAQTDPGDGQWSEIMFAISQLTRVGNDQTKSLQNVNAVQVLINANATIVVRFNSASVLGGFQPDVGDLGFPYMYWLRGRSSVTGARSNASPIMRYGVSPRRQEVRIPLPGSFADAQCDTWDIFRQGGSITVPRYLGSTPIGTSSFADNYGDEAIAGNDEMETSNYQPFTSIGPPIKATAASVIGSTMVVTFPTASASPAGAGTLSQIAKLLFGNLVNVGQQVFTLWTRPTFISQVGSNQTWLFQFVENAGVLTNPLVTINEPALAEQSNQFVWGPDPNGVFFAVGDPLRAGVVSRTNPQNPDSTGEGSADELCAPTEPLQNGALISGVSCVASPLRWWAGYPQQGGPSPYRWVEIQVGRGLAAPFGICSDGSSVYFWAKDGICRHSLGHYESLTDDDLSNLFPHEGVFPQNVTYGGLTIFPPDYKYAANFRLAVCNRFLFADYLDANKNQRTLVYDIRRKAWSVDVTTPTATIHATPTAPASNDQGPATAVLNQQLFIGDVNGGINVEVSSGGAESVAWVVATREEMMGDIRASKQYGDASLDLTPKGGNVTAKPVFLGTVFGTSTVIAGASSTRLLAVVNLLGLQVQRSMGLLLSGTDVGAQTKLFSWQPSYIPEPESIQNRIGDWDDAGSPGAKFFQGFILEANTNSADKQLSFRNGDSLAIEQTIKVNHNGQQEKGYSFAHPFVAHLVREEPDQVPWQKYGIRWVWEPTPETVEIWETQGTAFGLTGFLHVQRIVAAYISNAPVTLTISCDGLAPNPVTLPSTGGKYAKVTVILGINKGRVYSFRAASDSKWQPFVKDWEIYVGPWQRTGPYTIYRNIGGEHGDTATI